ncbi:hypothetical protein Tco_0054343 [Tanacetum coccineum]
MYQPPVNQHPAYQAPAHQASNVLEGPPGYYTKIDNRPPYGEKRLRILFEAKGFKWCNEILLTIKNLGLRDYSFFKNGCLDEYNWVFDKEIEQLADEYEIKIREKGQVLEEIWTKCKRARCKNKDWWYDYWYEDEEKIELGKNITNPPMVHTETFEVTKYKFDNGCSFICVNGENNETLSLVRKNGSRFRKMIMEEMKEVLRNDTEDSDNET